MGERRMRGVSAELRARAKELRRAPTVAEEVLWDGLRKCRIRVRRQHAIGTLVLDFYVPAAKLCVEVDGGIHDDPQQAAKDAARTEALGHLDIRVLRVTNDEVLNDLADVIGRIATAIG